MLALGSAMTADEISELGRGRPRRLGVDHAVAVRAEQGKVTDRPDAFTANVQRLDVMALDIALAAFPIEMTKSNEHTSQASDPPAATTLLIFFRRSAGFRSR